MAILIDLIPNASGHPLRHDWEAIERAFEYIEDNAPRPFTGPELTKACGNSTAARAVKQALLALDMAEPITPPRTKPMRYALTERGLPR